MICLVLPDSVRCGCVTRYSWTMRWRLQRKPKPGTDKAEYLENTAERLRDVQAMPDAVAEADPKAVRGRLKRMARGNPEHRDLRNKGGA